MPSLVTGYEYDIFISYRQKDNKYDGWVSDFVTNLKRELDATFKQEVSVYFDENRHDGLLETHDVYDSLKEKLKCVIFIPIISRTYCDPQSFAWKHEFLEFKKNASGDNLGLKIRLSNGNIASRIVPVRIHELAGDDQRLIENELGPLRAIDFTFSSAGVNRPLRSKDDDIKEIKHTLFYRDQINKVALAIREIIFSVSGTDDSIRSPTRQPINLRRRIPLLAVSISLVLLALVLFFVFNRFSHAGKMNSKPRIAILPFRLIGDAEGEYFAKGMKEVLVKHLQSMEQISVPPSLTQTDRYRETDLSHKAIADELNADFLIDASAQKWKDSIQLFIQLIDPAQDKIVWEHEFRQPFSEVFQVQTSMAKEIAHSLRVTVSPSVTQRLEKRPTSNLHAYDLLLQGNQFRQKWSQSKDNNFRMRAIEHYKESIRHDDQFAEPYFNLAMMLASLDLPEYRDSVTILIDKALELDPKFASALAFKSEISLASGDTSAAIQTAKQAIELNPYDHNSIMWLAWLHHYWLDDDQEVIGLQYYIQAYNAGPIVEDRAHTLWNMSIFFRYIGDYQRAAQFAIKAYQLMPEDLKFLNDIAGIYLESQQFEKIFSISEKMERAHDLSFQNNFEYLYWRAMADLYTHRYHDGLQTMKQFIEHNSDEEHWTGMELNYAILLKKNGQDKEAIEVCNQIIKNALNANKPQSPAFFFKDDIDVTLVRAYALTNNSEEALRILGKIKVTPFRFGLQEFFSVDLAVESLKNDARFKEFIQRERNRLKSIKDRVAQAEREKLLVIPAISGEL